MTLVGKHAIPKGRLTAVVMAIAALASSFGLNAADLPPAASQTIVFGRDVYPLLKAHCFRCHAGADAESGVRLDARRELLGETNGQPLVVIGRRTTRAA